MEYVKRYISLPKELNDKLAKERSASGTIVQALEGYYGHRANMRRLASKVDELNEHLKRLEPPSNDRYQMKVLVPGKPAVKVDEQEGLYFDPYIRQWKLIEEIDY